MAKSSPAVPNFRFYDLWPIILFEFLSHPFCWGFGNYVSWPKKIPSVIVTKWPLSNEIFISHSDISGVRTQVNHTRNNGSQILDLCNDFNFSLLGADNPHHWTLWNMNYTESERVKTVYSQCRFVFPMIIFCCWKWISIICMKRIKIICSSLIKVSILQFYPYCISVLMIAN